MKFVVIGGDAAGMSGGYAEFGITPTQMLGGAHGREH